MTNAARLIRAATFARIVEHLQQRCRDWPLYMTHDDRAILAELGEDVPPYCAASPPFAPGKEPAA